MDGSAFAIRPFRDADFAAEVRMDAEANPGHGGTEAEVRHWDELLRLDPGHVHFKLAVEELATGETVGYGSLAQPSFNYDPRWFWMWVGVAGTHRSRGIGARLFERLEAEARARDGVGMWASAREDGGVGLRFLEHRGFRALQKIWLSRLDLTTLDLARIPDRTAALHHDGIRFSTLAEEGATSPEVRRRLHHLSETTARDVPRMGRFHPHSFDEYVAMDLEAPGSMAEGMFLAWKGVELVGMSALERDLARTDTLRVGYTATHPEYRKLGIGTEVKRRAAAFARRQGYRYLVTGNNSENRSILAINQRFGFVPETAWVQCEKKLAERAT